jgi:hypothetical protein
MSPDDMDAPMFGLIVVLTIGGALAGICTLIYHIVT